jgi:signal peptidase I
MRFSRTRSLLVTAVVVALCALGWLYLAPTQIGGSTRYMITHGISMEPMLHTGDLVLVRPSDDYKVGQVVAYHSTLLHTVVLHRIIRIADGRYTFKGDNNDFVDPTHPTRALLVGRMWLHIPHGGTVLNWVHTPWVAALLTGGVAMLLLFGGEQKRRRRHRGGPRDRNANRPVRGPAPVFNRFWLAVSVVGVALFTALGIFAFLQPTVGTTTISTPYTQQLTFGYNGPARAGSVYPNGTVTTGRTSWRPQHPTTSTEPSGSAAHCPTTPVGAAVSGSDLASSSVVIMPSPQRISTSRGCRGWPAGSQLRSAQ